MTAGLFYKFKVEARNYLFYSEPSDPIVILCATVPVIPSAPTTVNEADYILIDWNAPVSNGLVIDDYVIAIKQFDGVFFDDITHCTVANDPNLLTTTSCTVPLASLTESPYYLSLDDAVMVKVKAGNAYGYSDYSQVGDGAVI